MKGPVTHLEHPARRQRDRRARQPELSVPALEHQGSGGRAVHRFVTLDVDGQVSFLLAGRYLWSAGPVGAAWLGGGGATFGVGGRSGPWTFGVRSGVFLPGRIPLRWCLRRELGQEELEVRLGLNLVTQRAPEFALETRVLLPVLGQRYRGLGQP